MLGGGGGRAGMGVPSAIMSARLIDRLITPKVAMQQSGDFTPWDPYRIERLPPNDPALQMVGELNTNNEAVFGIAAVKFHPYSTVGTSSLTAAQSAFAAALRSPNPAEQTQRTSSLAFGRSPFALASRAVAISVSSYTIIFVVRGTGPLCQSTLPPFAGQNATLPGATAGLDQQDASSISASATTSPTMKEEQKLATSPIAFMPRSPFATPRRKPLTNRVNPSAPFSQLLATPTLAANASHVTVPAALPAMPNPGDIPSTPLKTPAPAAGVPRGSSGSAVQQLLSSPGGSVFTASSAGVAGRAMLVPLMRFRTDFAQTITTAQNAMVWTSDGSRLITAGTDGVIRAFLVDDAEVFASTLTGHINAFVDQQLGDKVPNHHKCIVTEPHTVPTVSPLCLVIGACISEITGLSITPDDAYVFSTTGEVAPENPNPTTSSPVDGSASLLAWRVPSVEDLKRLGQRIPHKIEPSYVDEIAAEIAAEDAEFNQQVSSVEASGGKKPRRTTKRVSAEKQRERMVKAYPVAFAGYDAVRPIFRIPAASPDTRIMSALFWTPLPPSRQGQLPPCSTGVFVGPKGLEPIATSPQRLHKSRVAALNALAGTAEQPMSAPEDIRGTETEAHLKTTRFDDEGIPPTAEAWHKAVDEECLLTIEYHVKSATSSLRFWCLKHALFERARLQQTTAGSKEDGRSALVPGPDGVLVVHPSALAMLHCSEPLGKGLASRLTISPCRQFIGIATDRLMIYTSPSAPRVRAHVLSKLGLGVSPQLASLRPLTRVVVGDPVFNALPCSGLAFDPISRMLMGVSPSKAVVFLHNKVTDVAARKVRPSRSGDEDDDDDYEDDESVEAAGFLGMLFCCCIWKRLCCSRRESSSWSLFIVNLLLVLLVAALLQGMTTPGAGGRYESRPLANLESFFQTHSSFKDFR